MTFTINNIEVTLKQSFRSLVMYEQMAGHSFNPTTTFDILLYLYAHILGSSKEVKLSFDEFMDWIDDNPQIVTEFGNWLIEEAKRSGDFETAQLKQPETETPESKKN